MIKESLSNTVSTLTHHLGMLALAVFTLAAVSFLIALKFGGENRKKRKLIFTGCTFISIMVLMLTSYIILKQ